MKVEVEQTAVPTKTEASKKLPLTALKQNGDTICCLENSTKYQSLDSTPQRASWSPFCLHSSSHSS